MRVVHKAADLANLLDEAQGEAGRAFGNPAVFLENTSRAPSTSRSRSSATSTATSSISTSATAPCSAATKRSSRSPRASACPITSCQELCEAAARMAKEIRYDNAGTVEFLYDLDRHEWFFIEMNPRIQVEHTVTEVITGLDLVRAQILIARATPCTRPRSACPQADVPAQRLRDPVPHHHGGSGEQVHARLRPHLAYRSPGGFGVRLDGGMGYAGAVITPFYDSMLVKSITSGQTYDIAINRARRVLSRVPHPRREDEHSVPRKRHRAPAVPRRPGDDHADRHHPELFKFKPRRDRATKLLNFLGNVIVNGNPHAKGYRPGQAAPAAPCPLTITAQDAAPGTRDLLLELGAKGSPNGRSKQKRLLVTDTTFRDAHQSLMATRVRSYDMLACADASRRALSSSRSRCGAARRSTPRCVSSARTRGNACASCARRCRTSVSRCSSAAPTPSATPTIPTTSSPAS
jgi:pyruvate carboxylase